MTLHVHDFRCDTLKDTKIVVIDGRDVKYIDTTVAKNLTLLLADLEARKLQAVLWNWCEDVRKILVTFDSSTNSYFRATSNVSQLVTGKSI